MIKNTLLPWHANIWKGMSDRLSRQQFPHAVLFHGQRGVGKNQFAQFLAQALLCVNQNACGVCSACVLFSAGSHPDFVRIEPEGAANMIRVDAVRDVIEFVQTSPLISQYKVICIDQASAMNAFSANALLKTLEEPPSNTVFILICHDHLNLPATMISRCQKIFFAAPERETALHWLTASLSDYTEAQCTAALRAASGAPLLAEQLLKSGLLEQQQAFHADFFETAARKIHPSVLAEKWSAKAIAEVISVRQCLDWIFMAIHGMLLQPETKMTRSHLLDYISYIQQLCGWVKLSPSLNRQLILEDAFIRWVKLCNL